MKTVSVLSAAFVTCFALLAFVVPVRGASQIVGETQKQNLTIGAEQPYVIAQDESETEAPVDSGDSGSADPAEPDSSGSDSQEE